MRARTFCLGLAVALACSPASTVAQQGDIHAYIHQGWDSLSRSMTDCASFADSKLTTAPVLYLPAEETIPAAVAAMQTHCKVDVRHLPRTIRHEGDLPPDEIATPGLLYLPNRYVVPGGRFNEMYGWDSYFILLGELADGRVELARGTVENFFYEIDHYGSILNANRTYYLTRSQPPFLSAMVMAVYQAMSAAHPAEAKAWLRRAMPYMVRDHALWTSAPHLAGATGLSRYFDLGHGPVPEMADDSTYYLDVIRWLQAHHFAQNAIYLRKADAEDGCRGKANCLATAADGLALTESFFAGDRAMRESGFDTSFRFGPFSGSTQEYAPVCLNSLLLRYEMELAGMSAWLGDRAGQLRWRAAANKRKTTMNRLMWDERAGMFMDYDFGTGKKSDYKYVTTYYALWSGLATKAQAKRLRATLPVFEHAGGLAMSAAPTGMQWDAPFGWAPTNWMAVEGLARYGYRSDAQRIAREFSASVEKNFAHDGTIREKYNVESADANVAVSAGYKANVVGFGWTNGVYAVMQGLLKQ